MNNIRANAAAANDHDSAAQRDFGAVKNCSNAGGDAASEQDGAIEWVGIGDGDNRQIGGDDAFAERAHLAELPDIGIIAMHAECAIEQGTAGGCSCFLARVGVSRGARRAGAARGNKAKDNVVAHRASGDAGANRLDHARAFMPERHWQVGAQFTRNDVIVGVADAGSDHAYLHLVFMWWIKLDLFNAHRFTGRIYYCGACLHY